MIIGLVMAFAGSVWALQGLNASFAPQSFMTANRQWVIYGALTAVSGLAIAFWSWKRS